jgi:hypothetical protein
MFVILATNQAVRTKIPRLAETERGTKGKIPADARAVKELLG